MNDKKSGFFSVAKDVFIGKAKNPFDHSIFHNLSLVAFLAWVGLGADGLTSSCYGPEEAYLALGQHQHLILFVAMATAITVFLVSSSYSQIIELFPSGGGGYLVASKLLSPSAGMISGCALLIDYVLTITLSVASGTDAIFSFLPETWLQYKLGFAVLGLFILTILNLRGVKESVISLIPIFLVFLITHLIVIIYTFGTHIPQLPEVFKTTGAEIKNTHIELGWFGMLFLIMKAYSMGAGTFTGIEAVSNGINILREPRVQTGKRTMQYMAWSLSITVVGLMTGYLLFGVGPTAGKTLNAVLFGNLTQNWGKMGMVFVLITLLSEAILLFVAAQTGFIGGPRVLANMALDRWFPSRFASLSDRLVTQNGILLMGGAALILMVLAKGSVKFMVVLYSINVFVTFCMAQTGMVRHWWQTRQPGWKHKLLINGSGLALCLFILLSVITLKFFEGGWITLLITGILVVTAACIKKHYNDTYKQLQRLDHQIRIEKFLPVQGQTIETCEFNPESKTAVLLVNGFNGLGMHALLTILRLFGKEFRNFVFVQVGIIDAGTFKGAEEMDHLQQQTNTDIQRYVQYMNSQGFYAKGFSFVGLDIVQEMDKQTENILKRYPSVVFFGGQLVFPSESRMNRWLHNYTVFALQRMFYLKGIPFVVLPVRLSRSKNPKDV